MVCGRSQYTGNIRFIAQQTQGISYGATVQAYRYDQLMRLNSMNTYLPDATAISNWNITTTAGQAAPLQGSYKEGTITYDRNGNILTYQRWGASASVQDNLTYSYIAGTNKLNFVGDAVAAASFTTDFDGQSTGNYSYDGAGNLTGDAQSFISAGGITWNPYGKIMQVDKTALASQTYFAYDAMQNRIKKRKVASGTDISTFYIRDAQGNVLAVYEKNGTTVTWKEQHLYGSSRLGTVEPGVAWTTTPAATPYFRSTRILNYGWKRYEVNDHLGNVRALINDRKTYGGATFAATLLDATDYFPFGAEMRKGTVTNSYRYGFNGKELDKTEFGSLNHYDYGFRIYNPGIGRFLSVDPLTGSYPELTPYQFASNNPIWAIDLDGLEGSITTIKFWKDSQGNTQTNVTENWEVAKENQRRKFKGNQGHLTVYENLDTRKTKEFFTPEFEVKSKRPDKLSEQMEHFVQYITRPIQHAGKLIKKEGDEMKQAGFGASTEMRLPYAYTKLAYERYGTSETNGFNRFTMEGGIRGDGYLRVNPNKEITMWDYKEHFKQESIEQRFYMFFSDSEAKPKNGVGDWIWSMSSTTKIPIWGFGGIYHNFEAKSRKHELGFYFNSDPQKFKFQTGGTLKGGAKVEWNNQEKE